MVRIREKVLSILYDICEETHASCNDNCPIFNLNQHKIPYAGGHPYDNCFCFKDSKRMLDFVISKMEK